MTVFKLTVYFDMICAWSYIGHRTLFQAIELFQRTYPAASKDTFNIRFHPFYRDRALPELGVPLHDRLTSAFGEQRTEEVLKQVRRVGIQHGIVFGFKGKIGHTRKAHQLVHHVGDRLGPEPQRALVERIYYRWFEGQNDITSNDFLVECATLEGLDESSVRAALADEKLAGKIDLLDANMRAQHVKAVPTFDIGGNMLEGAADVQTFFDAFVKIKDMERDRV